MRITIIPIDNAVYKDDKCYIRLDLSSCNIPNNIHALQWNNNKGWIEYKTNDDGSRPENEDISELPTWVDKALLVWEERDILENTPPDPIVVK